MPQTTSSLSREAPETTPQRKATPQVAAAPVPRAPEPEPAAGPRTPRSSGYEIELAALSDRFRAEAIAKQVMVQYSSDFFWSSRKTRLDERPGPEGSTIYGVRLGVYGDEASARDFCGKLEAGGFDCQIVARR
jgi:cell division septation protein DedD